MVKNFDVQNQNASFPHTLIISTKILKILTFYQFIIFNPISAGLFKKKYSVYSFITLVVKDIDSQTKMHLEHTYLA